MVIKTDSSKTGWGGIIEDTTKKTGGHWSYCKQQNHINYLELKAAYLTLKVFCQHRHICMLSYLWTIQLQSVICSSLEVGKNS